MQAGEVSRMAEPITSYVEERCEWGGADRGKPAPGVMQVLYEGDAPRMVDFLCPCGCGNTCPTHLKDPSSPKPDGEWERHCWAFSRGPNGITLTPSILWMCGCKAHFNITDGKVIMHADSGK